MNEFKDVDGLDDIDFSKYPNIVSTTVQNGIPRVEGTETTVFNIGRGYENHDLTPEQMANDFGVKKSEVFEALAFYYEFKAELVVAEQNRDW